jgi:hypothetical protein
MSIGIARIDHVQVTVPRATASRSRNQRRRLRLSQGVDEAATPGRKGVERTLFERVRAA